MLFKVTHGDVSLGQLELGPEKFDFVDWKDAGHEQVLRNLLAYYYDRGVPNAIRGDVVDTVPLKPSDPSFFIVLLEKLIDFGYIFTLAS